MRLISGLLGRRVSQGQLVTKYTRAYCGNKSFLSSVRLFIAGVKPLLEPICASLVYELLNLSLIGSFQLVIGGRLLNCQRFNDLKEPTAQENPMARALR